MEIIKHFESQGWYWSLGHTKDFPYQVRMWKHTDWRNQTIPAGKPYNPQKRIVYSGTGNSIEEATINLKDRFNNKIHENPFGWKKIN